MPRWLYFLLIFALLTPLLEFLRAPSLLVFVVAALGIIPLAALIGQGVEMVAEHTGEQIGGLLFATFGNATELIISLFALSAGLVDVVRASIIGSILGNALLVLGVSVFIGSVKHGRLHFKARPASQYSSLLALSVGGLMLPTIAELLASREHQSAIALHGEQLSDVIAVLLLAGYLASILFSVFRIGDKGGGDEDFGPVLGARSISAITRLLTYRHHIAQSDHPGKSGVLRQIDGAVHAIVAHEADASGMKIPGTTTPSTKTQEAPVPPAMPPEALAGNVALAYQARSEVPWGATLPEGVFLDAVLPHASTTEPREPMRREFHDRYLPMARKCRRPGEAALELNKALFRDDKVVHETQYFADPFEAPAWRSQWVQRTT